MYVSIMNAVNCECELELPVRNLITPASHI